MSNYYNTVTQPVKNTIDNIAEYNETRGRKYYNQNLNYNGGENDARKTLMEVLREMHLHGLRGGAWQAAIPIIASALPFVLPPLIEGAKWGAKKIFGEGLKNKLNKSKLLKLVQKLHGHGFSGGSFDTGINSIMNDLPSAIVELTEERMHVPRQQTQLMTVNELDENYITDPYTKNNMDNQEYEVQRVKSIQGGATLGQGYLAIHSPLTNQGYSQPQMDVNPNMDEIEHIKDRERASLIPVTNETNYQGGKLKKKRGGSMKLTEFNNALRKYKQMFPDVPHKQAQKEVKEILNS